MQMLVSYSWMIIPILGILFYKFTLRFFFGMVIIPEDKIGLVTKKFVLFGANKSLPDGKIIALNGEAGFQADTLAPGLYWGYWVWQFSIGQTDLTIIPKGKVGLLSAKDGKQLPTGAILARHVDCDNYQDATAFLQNGGQKGRQSAYITNGSYKINTFLFEVSAVKQVSVQENMVGIVNTGGFIQLETSANDGSNALCFLSICNKLIISFWVALP